MKGFDCDDKWFCTHTNLLNGVRGDDAAFITEVDRNGMLYSAKFQSDVKSNKTVSLFILRTKEQADIARTERSRTWSRAGAYSVFCWTAQRRRRHESSPRGASTRAKRRPGDGVSCSRLWRMVESSEVWRERSHEGDEWGRESQLNSLEEPEAGCRLGTVGGLLEGYCGVDEEVLRDIEWERSWDAKVPRSVQSCSRFLKQET